MSEATTTEQIAEAEWRLKDYWTKLRVPVKVRNGWSDIDVLAYDPESKHLVITEVKAQQGKNVVFGGPASHYWTEFTASLPLYCRNGEIFGNFRKSVKHLTVQLVSNWVSTPHKPDVVARAKKDVVAAIDFRNVDVMLDTHIEVLARLLTQERDLEVGRRYGNPVLDVVREVNRYLHPSVRGAGRSGSSINETKARAIQPLLRALGVESSEGLDG